MHRVYNAAMKRRTLCLLCILMLAAAGTAGFFTLALRPALLQQRYGTETENAVDTQPQALPSWGTEDSFDLHYPWNLRENAAHTLLVGDAELLSLLEGNTVWKLDFRFENDRLTLHSAAPELHPHRDATDRLHTRFSCFFSRTSHLRMPNGRVHPQYHLCLMAELTLTPCFWQKPRRLFLLQEMQVDITDRAADIIHTEVPRFPGVPANIPVQQVITAMQAPLPTRFCGSYAEQGLERHLLRLAQIADRDSLAQQLPFLRKEAEELTAVYADPTKPWPDCWGDAAEKAEQNARRVIPVLLRLQEAECYESDELADFINSPLFSRLYGEGN